MTPSIRQRLDSVACSLSEIIIPALESMSGLGKEQAELALCQIRLLSKQVDHAALYNRIEREEASDLAVLVCDRAAGGSATTLAKGRLSALIARGADRLEFDADQEAWTRELGFAIEALVEACSQDGTQDARRHVARCVMAYERRKVQRDRTMFKEGGFDAGVAAIEASDLADVLRRDRGPAAMSRTTP